MEDEATEEEIKAKAMALDFTDFLPTRIDYNDDEWEFEILENN